jgi:hypothetical protein
MDNRPWRRADVVLKPQNKYRAAQQGRPYAHATTGHNVNFS